jgi:hypothetical protein
MKKILLSILFCFVWGLLPSHAQMDIYVRTKRNERKSLLLLGRNDKILRTQPKGETGGEIPLNIAEIAEIQFSLPNATLSQAQRHYTAGQWDQTLKVMSPLINPLLSYIDLPGNNLMPIVLTYAEVLRFANKFDEAHKIYAKIAELPNAGPDAAKGNLWAIYCLVAMEKKEDANKQFNKIEPPTRGTDTFPLYKMVSGKLLMFKKDYQTAIDEMAQVTAFSRIESELFPETLYLLAQSYEGWSAAIKEKKEKEKEKNKTKDDPAKPADDAPDPQLLASQRIYLEITRNFPETNWAKLSQPKVPKTAKKTAKDKSAGSEKEATKDVKKDESKNEE